MNFINNIKEKTVIVCPSSVKNKILNRINEIDNLVNVKIYSLEELKRIIYLDYDVNAILYLIEKYNYSYDIANYYISNLYYIEDKEYDNEKLDFLVNLKKELDDKCLLKYNNVFNKSYKNTKFLVFGYDYLDSFDKKILSNFNYEVIDEEVTDRVNEVYKFNTLEEEILFVINEIISLIEKKVSLNNIYLLNIDSNYKDEIIRLFSMFNLPIDINNSSSIISSIVGNKVFYVLKENKSFEETVKYMDSLNLDQNIYNIILNIFNKYTDLDYSFDSILKCVKYDFENTIINTNTYKNSIKIGELNNSYYDKDDYVFLLGFNQGSIPKVYKDEDYISDNLKELLGLDTTNKLNKERIKATKRNINKIKNITITYKKHYMKEEFYPSNYLSEDDFAEKEVKTLSTDNSLIYSKLKLAKMLDNLINYDENNGDLSKYFYSLEDINYMNYDNKYNKIDKKALHKYINSKDKHLLLSYTSVDEFFKCQFRYYITKVLKLNKYEDSFDIFLGNLFHYVLSKMNERGFDFDKEYDDYLKNNSYIKSKKEYTSKELFYIDKLRKELKISSDFIMEFHNESTLSKIDTEKPENIDKSKEDLNIVFTGKIDKIMSFDDGDKTLISVIDYKTGNTDIKLDYAKEGIGLQLFIYLYLISNDDTFKNPYFVGFYLKNILNEIKTSPKKTCLEQKLNELRLNGYSTDNRDYLKEFDPTYESSKYIRSMSITKDNNFSSNSKILDEDSMKSFIDFIDKKVDEARDKVIDAEFDINPKYYNGDNTSVGCDYCNYKDICFMKDKDYVRLNKNKAFDFLKEGDLND